MIASRQTETIAKIDKWTNLLLWPLVAIPFILSAEALADMALENGTESPFNWLYPLMIDGGLIIFKLLALRGALRGRTDRYAWSMAGIATALSVVLNVLHAPDNLTAQVMAGLPPLAILTAFIAVTRRIQEQAKEENIAAGIAALEAQQRQLEDKLAAEEAAAAKRRAALQAEAMAAEEAAQAKIAAAQATLGQLQEDIAAARREAKTAKAAGQATGQTKTAAGHADAAALTDRQKTILQLLRTQPDITQEDIAAQLEISPRTVRRDIKAMNGAVKELT